MKVEKNKHDHKLTNWLKVGIFAILMLAPILGSLSQMLYVTFNKNAYQSYTERTYKTLEPINYQTNEIETDQDFIIGNIYRLSIDASYNINASNNIINVEKILNYSYTGTTSTYGIYSNVPYILKNNNVLIYTFTTENTDNTITLTGNGYIDFVYLAHQRIDELLPFINACPTEYIKEYIEVEQNGTLDNAFYFGVDQMTKSDLFNWTQNTALYTGIKAMTDNLQIQTNVIAILLTYWSILTIVYVIIDIVLKGFTFLTHMIVRSD